MIGNSLPFGIPQGHPYPRVGNATGTVHFRRIGLPHLVTAGKTHLLYIASFVARYRETIVHPQERTNLHPVVGLAQLLQPVGPHTDDFAGTHIAVYLIIQIGQAARLAGSGVGTFLVADDDGRTSPLVTRHDDAVFGEEQHGAGALDATVDILDTVYIVLAFHDKQGHQLGGIDFAHAHLGQVHVLLEQLGGQLFKVVDFGHRNNGELAQVRVDHDGLRVVVADDTDTGVALKTGELRFELGAEIRTFQAVDSPHETCAGGISGHTATFGSQMRIIVCTVEQICHTFRLCDCTEKTSHLLVVFTDEYCVFLNFECKITKKDER